MLVDKSYDFQTPLISEGATILINKPAGWTSFDVVNKLKYALKRHFHLPKVKIGHTGTLDPLAEGLVMICVGKHTKKIEAFTGLDKVYTGRICLGATTASFDLEQPINQTFPTEHITESQIISVLGSFIGPQEQIPPVFSAKRVDGHRAYVLARKGETPEMKKSSINIYEFEAKSIEIPVISFYIRCSKGTYIRSLARDLGTRLNSGAHLQFLQRDAIGPYQLINAFSIDEFLALLT